MVIMYTRTFGLELCGSVYGRPQWYRWGRPSWRALGPGCWSQGSVSVSWSQQHCRTFFRPALTVFHNDCAAVCILSRWKSSEFSVFTLCVLTAGSCAESRLLYSITDVRVGRSWDLPRKWRGGIRHPKRHLPGEVPRLAHPVRLSPRASW